MEYSLRILPELRDFLEPLEPDEKETLERLLLAEGCRDPLVVWEEKNAILDGHNRYEICKKHGIPYTVIYYSFPNMEAALAWMEENQNGRRNWSREARNRYIKRRLARGDTHKAVADDTGLSRVRITQIAKKVNNLPSDQPSPITRPDPELLRLQKELAARDEFERQQGKTEGSEHFGNSEVRWVDNLLYLYTNQFDIVVDSFARLSHSIKYLRAASGTF
jgi:transposase-like protein